MNAPTTPSNILIASDKSTDAALVKRLLSDRYDGLYVSTLADKAVEDFEQRMPEVLVLAFDALEKAERYYLGLYRLSSKIHLQRHRTVILCGKEDVNRVSELCMKRHFDDYVLFWPMNHDAPRLPMAVHQALRDLKALRQGEPSIAEFAAQARRLAELEALLDQQVTLGGSHIDVASRAMEQAEQDLGAALGGLTQRLGHGPDQNRIDAAGAAHVEQEIQRFRQQDMRQLFHAAAESVQPLKRWSEDFRRGYAPHMASMRSLTAMAERVRPKILVVDDDSMQRKILVKILENERYELLTAASGAEALNVLRTSTPDVILMDVQMPDIDGIAVTRRLKAVPQFAAIPVMMITGKSGGNVVVDSLKAGAADFVVKPVDPAKLIAKLARLTRAQAAPAARPAPPSPG